MSECCLVFEDALFPVILAEEADFLVAYKPPRMHSVPQAASRGNNMLEYLVKDFPEIMKIEGRREGEGGMLHRLDFETQGLLLIARTSQGMEALLGLQSAGKIVKEYSAVAMKSEMTLPGFPMCKPEIIPMPCGEEMYHDAYGTQSENAFCVKSAFRPHGKGRKAVRPVAVADGNDNNPGIKGRSREIAFDHGKPYVTEICKYSEKPAGVGNFLLRIRRGFRHQIRSHLAWMRMPILNDLLYGGIEYGRGLLALRACSIAFNDPFTGEYRRYSIAGLQPDTL